MPTFPDLAGRPTSPKTPSIPSGARSAASKTKQIDRGPLVNKIIEGLRGDAFAIARDVGLDQLTAPGGLELLITQIKAHVFPRAQEEANELFRAGQRLGGPLARQPLEPMLSYTQRRRRWWRTLVKLDPSMQLSDSLRMELMLELSGLSRQEGLVVRACATTKDIEGVAEDEYDYHDDVDEYEAAALNCLVDVEDVDEKQAGDAIQLHLAAHTAFGKAKGKGKFGKGKGKSKLVRFQLTIEQRRAKLAELKKRSKCMRCGAMGHWAGDPQLT
eukprot:s1209_g9.t1